jgi:hypothetical protein
VKENKKPTEHEKAHKTLTTETIIARTPRKETKDHVDGGGAMTKATATKTTNS